MPDAHRKEAALRLTLLSPHAGCCVPLAKPSSRLWAEFQELGALGLRVGKGELSRGWIHITSVKGMEGATVPHSR